MTIALMFLTSLLARVAVSNTVKAATAVAAWLYKTGWGNKADPQTRTTESKVSDTTAPHRPKRRHPHQVMRWEDLDVGREYTSVHVRECDGRMFEYRRTFAGAFSGEPEESQLPAPVAGHYERMRFTVHLDGRMFDGSLSDKPSYLLWGGDGKPNTYSSVDYLLGVDDTPVDQHQLLVPTDRWQADPHVAVDWTVERPRGEAGEMVWMYDSLRHEQLAAIIDGDAEGATNGAGEPVYYVTFVRGGGGGGSCNLQRRGELTVRRDSEPVDELGPSMRGEQQRKRRTDDYLRAIFGG